MPASKRFTLAHGGPGYPLTIYGQVGDAKPRTWERDTPTRDASCVACNTKIVGALHSAYRSASGRGRAWVCSPCVVAAVVDLEQMRNAWQGPVISDLGIVRR